MKKDDLTFLTTIEDIDNEIKEEIHKKRKSTVLCNKCQDDEMLFKPDGTSISWITSTLICPSCENQISLTFEQIKKIRRLWESKNA